MKRFLWFLAVPAAFALGFVTAHVQPRPASAAPATSPAQGFTMHIDAQKHFGSAHPTEIAHHWCKPVRGLFAECLIFDSDAPNARLVEVETIVSPQVYHAMPRSEQAYWHWHKYEIPRVNATMPGMSPAQVKKAVAAINPTYGKIWMLWDPLSTANGWPMGAPRVMVLH